ncbi:uncharacterized protein LOC135837675 isoform X2 [Planococcus citri]|uniref:uncharacterized protein LOC135837675 isoform X2 n=1 Tax=Planococcus citri TaxID=170843 RepID=UPI0031F7DEB4
MTSASVQAAVYVREKQRLRQKRTFSKTRYGDLPSHVATRDIAPFPMYPPTTWGKSSVVWFDREKRGALSPGSEIVPPLLSQHSQGKLRISDAHRKWAKRNKIHENSLGMASSEDLRGGLHRQYDAAANMLLYVGLCAVALGLVIAFVGTGEKGFKTVQLRMIGPTMIGCGTFCCFLRILFCFCPTKCMRKRFKHRHKNKTVTSLLSDAAQLNRQAYLASDKAHLEYYKHLPFRSQNFLLFEQTQQQQASLLKENKKRVSIAARPHERRIGNNDVPDFIIDDAASDTLSTLRELSPLHEEDLIDFQQSSNSFENLPSLDSSVEYLNEKLNEEPAGNAASGGQNAGPSQSFITEEQLNRLKSTLTFRDSVDFADSRLMISYDEFDLQDELKFAPQDGKKDEGVVQSIADKPTRSAEEHLLDSSNQELVLSVGTLQKH